MSKLIEDVTPYLRCPDDKALLMYQPDALTCSFCRRAFPILGDRVIELLPREPRPVSAGVAPSYYEDYVREFMRRFLWDRNAVAWGAPERMPISWVRKRQRHVRWALPLALAGAQGRGSVLCDISAGAGYYTLAYAPYFQYILHCDLSVDALNYAFFKAQKLAIDNIVFLRVDYLSPPFRESLERVICFDTLIRGEEHERALLASIKDALRAGGIAVIDFHHWWHNPLRRLGLMRQNFGQNRSYKRREAEALVRERAEHYAFYPFHQEFERDTIGARLLAKLVPPTRLVYRFLCSMFVVPAWLHQEAALSSSGLLVCAAGCV